MGILIALLPALGWGAQALVMQKIGGKFTNKNMGLVLGMLIMSIFYLFFHPMPALTSDLIWGSILSGIPWSIAMILQIKSYDYIGVSKAMPLSTGGQLVLNALVGVLFFHEWNRAIQLTLGIGALIIIFVGILMTAFEEKIEVANPKENTTKKDTQIGIIITIISVFGFVAYSVVPRIFDLNGADTFFPQSVAMFISTSIIILFQKDNDILGKKTWHNIPTGFCFGVAGLTLLISNQMNGVAVGFTLSQLSVVVSTLGGIFLLHEAKTKKEMRYIVCGMLLIVVGAIMIGITKN